MTDEVNLQPSGVYNYSGRIVTQHVPSYGRNSSRGQRVCLGFFGASGASYIHVKMSAGGSANRMHKFEYDGYTYSSLNVHNSVTFYTYHGTSVPYQPSLVNWGETTGGIVNYYYSSSDDKVVIVLQTSSQYTGGFLYHQTGASHVEHDIDVVAHTSSANTSGVY
tara:strand:- start:1737 stop:2228 length:492 start_codon:yes stop_codon:yes gene_type:complete